MVCNGSRTANCLVSFFLFFPPRVIQMIHTTSIFKRVYSLYSTKELLLTWIRERWVAVLFSICCALHVTAISINPQTSWNGVECLTLTLNLYIRYIKYIQPRKTQSVAKCYNICTIAIQRFQKRKMQSLKLVCLGWCTISNRFIHRQLNHFPSKMEMFSIITWMPKILFIISDFFIIADRKSIFSDKEKNLKSLFKKKKNAHTSHHVN